MIAIANMATQRRISKINNVTAKKKKAPLKQHYNQTLHQGCRMKHQTDVKQKQHGKDTKTSSQAFSSFSSVEYVESASSGAPMRDTSKPFSARY